MAGNESAHEVNARIVYWGVEGSGKTACVQTIHAKLRPDHRGELKRVPTRLDPTVHYDELPIALGNVQGARTQLQIVAVPGGPEHAATRKQLLDRVDGIVVVIDAEPSRADENVESVVELRDALGAYGRSLDELPFVVQYNKCDLGDPYETEALHRRLGFGEAPVFETVASQGQGVLQVLSTISKSVVRNLRDRRGADLAPQQPPLEPAPAPVVQAKPAPAPQPVVQARPAPAPQPVEDSIMDPSTPLSMPEEAPVMPAAQIVSETVVHLDDPSSAEAILEAEPLSAGPGAASDPRSVMEAAILSEGEGIAEVSAADDAASRTELAFDRPWAQLADEKPAPGARFGPDLRVVSVGTAERSGERGVRVPLVLGNDEGETLTVALTVQLEPLLEDDPG